MTSDDNATDTTKRVYEVHPLAEIFPPLEGPAFDALVADIMARGLQELIWLYQGKILDGRNRYRACQQAGCEPKTRNYEGDDPVGFVLSANLHRRHLNESQRAMVAAKLVTTKLGDNRWKVGQSIDQPTAAKMLNVSTKSVQRAKEVCDKATFNIQKFVQSGKVPVSVAAKVAALPKQKQVGLTTASAIKDAVAPPQKEKPVDAENGKKWLQSLPVNDLVFWLKEFHKTNVDYLKKLCAGVTCW